MNALLHRLSMLHRKLDEEIRRELAQRFPNSIKLLRLKKLKLMAKDRMYRHYVRRRGTA